jgi:hypothetical protein
MRRRGKENQNQLINNRIHFKRNRTCFASSTKHKKNKMFSQGYNDYDLFDKNGAALRYKVSKKFHNNRALSVTLGWGRGPQPIPTTAKKAWFFTVSVPVP